MKTQLFAHHEQALRFREMRSQILTSNIANADTPNYKARDVEFRGVLDNARTTTISMARTHAGHTGSAQPNALGGKVMYRVPTQPSLDGNTVQTDVEQAEFAENAIKYRTTLAFLDGQIRGLRYAIKGTD